MSKKKKEKDWTEGLKICGGLALGFIALKKLVENLEEPDSCKKVFIPEDVCEITFEKETTKKDHSKMMNFTTARGEEVILHFYQKQLVSIELLGPKKPCQQFKEDEKNEL